MDNLKTLWNAAKLRLFFCRIQKNKLKCFVHLIFECFKTSIKERASIVMSRAKWRWEEMSHENTMRSWGAGLASVGRRSPISLDASRRRSQVHTTLEQCRRFGLLNRLLSWWCWNPVPRSHFVFWSFVQIQSSPWEVLYPSKVSSTCLLFITYHCL